MVENSKTHRPYPAYRPSGVEWLGNIPMHWKTIRLKSVLARNDSGVWGEEPGNHGGTVVLRSTEQTIDGGWAISDPARRGLSSRERADALLAVGDLVVTKSSGSEFHIGKTSLVTEDVAGLQACFSNFIPASTLLACSGTKVDLVRTQFSCGETTTGLQFKHYYRPCESEWKGPWRVALPAPAPT